MQPQGVNPINERVAAETCLCQNASCSPLAPPAGRHWSNFSIGRVGLGVFFPARSGKTTETVRADNDVEHHEVQADLVFERVHFERWEDPDFLERRQSSMISSTGQ
jgi:hypothetical protein